MKIILMLVIVFAAARGSRFHHSPLYRSSFDASSGVTNVSCDIVIAGGSTASLATAITAAEADPSLHVCFTEITDWPGGQMTSGGVPAIDFGGSNRKEENQPSSFRDFFEHVDGNPGNCTVSIKCYQPQKLVETWIMPRLKKSPNLSVYLRTVISATTQSADGSVQSLRAVQRTARSNYTEWSLPLSKVIQEWYNPEDTDHFTKTLYDFNAKVFVEATEFADVLMTGKFPVAQGAETPFENSTVTDQGCGQAWTTTFYIEMLPEPIPPQPFPPGSDEGIPFGNLSRAEWEHTWFWRRAHAAGNDVVNVGDITQQNLGNDLDSAYPLLSIDDSKSGPFWAGGVNVTVLAMLEGRAYGYYSLITRDVPDPSYKGRVIINTTVSGTAHGLSKMPYLRDTRRTVGLNDFRLMKSAFSYQNDSDYRVGYFFPDSIALGNYNDDVHKLHSCELPSYILDHDTKPYWIPFRALTVANSSNLLVAGKTMAQTFHANGATRLHPSEWTSGVAAGGAAVLMVRNNWTTSDAYAHVDQVQSFLNSSIVGQPLLWELGPAPPGIIGYSCELGRCFGVTTNPQTNSTACDSRCSPLAGDEWLANTDYWKQNGTQLIATQTTVLKKSSANSQSLPMNKKVAVNSGAICTLVGDPSARYGVYALCTYNQGTGKHD